ncbi:MAG: hypothetical protein KGH52_03940 [Candidatus Micrarchaeota archaeon]|nr:hypothetical protein [Candidatus Micrarchaeota archaeon]
MNQIVAIPIDKQLADFIGKGSSEGSISFHNRKVDGKVVVGLSPSSLDDKFYAVAEILLVCDQVLISTANIDKLFGEVLVASSLLRKHVIFTDENDVASFVSGVGLKDYEVSPKEELLARITARPQANSGEPVRVDIDRAFPVKGIGCVALGIVTRGTLKVHDELQHSSGKVAGVKSIQSQDVDIQSADPGTRVGLALKGIEYTDMEKGDILTKERVQKVGSIKCILDVSKVSGEQIKEGGQYVLVSNFSRSNATIEAFDGGIASIKLDKQMAAMKGDRILLLREQSPRIFASGSVA